MFRCVATLWLNARRLVRSTRGRVLRLSDKKSPQLSFENRGLFVPKWTRPLLGDFLSHCAPPRAYLPERAQFAPRLVGAFLASLWYAPDPFRIQEQKSPQLSFETCGLFVPKWTRRAVNGFLPLTSRPRPSLSSPSLATIPRHRSAFRAFSSTGGNRAQRFVLKPVSCLRA